MTLPTLVRLTSSRQAVPAGEAVVLSATVTVLGREGTVPAGQVAFQSGSRVLGRAQVGRDGVAELPGLLLPAGFHALVATYSGDELHAGAASVPFPQAVLAPGLPVVVAVAAPRVSPEGVMLEAELLDAVSGRLAEDAEGEMVFVSGDREVARTPVRGGQARVLVAELPGGVLEAHFGGSADHAPGHGLREGGA